MARFEVLPGLYIVESFAWFRLNLNVFGTVIYAAKISKNKKKQVKQKYVLFATVLITRRASTKHVFMCWEFCTAYRAILRR